MKILMGADHAGFVLKEAVKSFLKAEGVDVHDFGTHSEESVDYPDYVHPLAKEVDHNPDTLKGILVCGSGNGVCITANKYAHVRAALVWNEELAKLCRQHNNSNVLCLPARFIEPEEALACVQAFLHTAFEGGRHKRRVEKINNKNS